MYFGTLPAGANLPRPGTRCAALITRRSVEPRPENFAANHTVPAGPIGWAQAPAQVHWRRWITKRRQVSGRFTGTTDEIIRWAACKWGLDENTIRAVAVYESNWYQSAVSDGGGSFGLLQVKDHYLDGSLDFGGYPWTRNSTALNADFYGAWIRSCLDGDFYDGGNWLYGGQTVKQLVAAHGFRYVFWGCIGAWYSGDWYTSGAVDYVAQVRASLADKSWLHLGG
jgi:hypothetical protein